MYKYFFKRFSDLILSIMALIILSPFIIFIISILCFKNQSSGVFFKQIRPGKNEKLFKIIKFKTMTDELDCEGNLLPDFERLTRFGKFLRSSSLDEVPQLFNIIKGDMSLIGPRPLLVEYLPLYNKQQTQRHNIRPGITGLAQVKGRNSISWENKFRWDIYYINHLTFKLDMKILYLTCINVLKHKDIGIAGTKEGSLVFEKFKGSSL
jgi:undecaprenyl phosphate N,N'-diacetylbacillosamine 1-phosphate transferase